MAAAVVAVLLVIAVTRARPPAVAVAEASAGQLRLRIAASGLVETDSANLGFQSGGKIVRLYAQEGDRVARSDILARIEPTTTVAATPGMTDSATTIQAPYSGTVVAVYAREGSVVQPGEPVLRFAASRTPWVTAFIDSEDAAHIKPGDEFLCRAGGYLSEPWQITVRSVGKEAIPRLDLPGSASQVRVRCDVVSRAFPLAPGTEVDLDGEVELVANALLIPTAAVIHEGPLNRVWVVEAGEVHRREVQTGPNNFDLIHIRSGLQAGDQVVIHGKESLREGQRVRAKGMPAATAASPGDD